MTNPDLVHTKLSDLQGYHAELSKILEKDTKEILSDNLLLHSVERLFQLIVDTAVDCNSHIISTSGFSVPNDYQSTFITLAENKFLPMDFALRIAPSVGLRNLIVHRYGKVDSMRMIDDIKKEIGQYREYARYISEALH